MKSNIKISIPAIALVVSLVCMGIYGLSNYGSSIPIKAQVSQKNIVFIMTDDQPYHTQQFMPRTNALIGDHGVKFTNAYNSTSLCCPSRASSLTGKYSHNTNILSNVMPWGGAELFKNNGGDQSTIATWLKGAGYKTYFIGKYLNEYGDIAPYQPPGWDEWHAMVKIGSEGGYLNWYMIENGIEKHYQGTSSAIYSVNVMRDKAVQLIRNTPLDQPLFLYFTPTAPHQPAIPDPADAGTFANLPPYRPPSYNEADVSDKPTWVRNLPLWTIQQQTDIDALYRRQVESLQSVDRAVEAIINALQETGRLENTAIVYTSDNGYSLGNHRWEKKECIYTDCSKTPLLVRVPGITPRVDDNLILNIDIPVTFAEWAGLVPPIPVDGQSFAGLLNEPLIPWRDNVLLEVFSHAHNRKMNFQGLATKQYLYGEYVDGDRELYDLISDPFELTNLYTNPTYSAIIADLHNKLITYKVPADLQLEILPSTLIPVPGGPLNYTINLRNLGPSHSASVYLTANFSNHLIVNSCTSTGGGVCATTGNSRLVKFISVPMATSATITVSTTVKSTTAPGTLIQSSAFVNGFSSIDANPTNDQPVVTLTAGFNVNPSPTITPTPTPTLVPTPTPTPTLDTTPPSISITNPKNNAKVAKNSTVRIAATASDNIQITNVLFYVNDVLICTDTTSPYSCDWLVPGGNNASYTIRAKAVDSSNNFKNAQVTITSR